MVGRVLGGRYEVLDRIGTGGMSLVYRARDLTLSRLVAVKVLKHQWAEDEDVVRRFDQEARAAASVVDRHVVQVYDVGQEEPDLHYMVMELVAGETLRVKIDREAPFEVETAVSIADQVAAALEAAHSKKLIHRDIKPHNILLAEDGSVKVTDFGIAYAAASGTLVNTGSLIGTVRYLSPEQARGKVVGPQSDLYSLGVVLFEMLTGRLPFEGDSAIGVAIKHLQDEAPTVKSLRPDVPDAVDQMVARALAKDPADRYQSAHAFRQDLSRFLRGDPLPAGVAGSLMLTSPGRGARRPDGGQPRRGWRRWWPWLLALALLLALAGGGVYAFNRWLNVPTVLVPNIKGQSLAAARSRLGAVGLALKVVGHSPSSTLPKNHVINEIPAPGSPVKPGQFVQVVVSSGQARVVVLDVKGQDVSQARQDLETLGLKVVVTHVAGNAPQGQVVRQSPKAGSSVTEGQTVHLWVSNGPPVTAATMPDLEGLTVAEASSELIGLNVSVGTPTTQWSTEPANTIIDQSPEPFTSLTGVSQVNVTVSSGLSPESANLPKNLTIVSWPIPASAPPKSVLKVVVTDAANNEEVFYQQVNPGTTVQIPVTWYGTTGQLVVFLNGQAEPPQTLTPDTAGSPPSSQTSSATPSSSASSSSTAPSGGGG